MLVITNIQDRLFFLISSMAEPQKTKFEIAVIDKVREMRQEKGFTQEYLAGLLDTVRSFVSQVESPNIPSKYNLNHLNKLAKELGCSPKDFMPDTFIEERDWTED